MPSEFPPHIFQIDLSPETQLRWTETDKKPFLPPPPPPTQVNQCFEHGRSPAYRDTGSSFSMELSVFLFSFSFSSFFSFFLTHIPPPLSHLRLDSRSALGWWDDGMMGWLGRWWWWGWWGDGLIELMGVMGWWVDGLMGWWVDGLIGLRICSWKQ